MKVTGLEVVDVLFASPIAQRVRGIRWKSRMGKVDGIATP